jgi:predicted SAM-dependent methyltransferase
MDRRDIILQLLDLEGVGIEIGPSHNPIAPKKLGFKVEVIDHLDRQGLIEKYQGHGVNLANIEDVDYVWHGESYADLTGKRGYFDWVIASHVIEHTPDFIGFLNQCDEILNGCGYLSLVIPDKRYCFDHFRAPSSLATLIDGHLSGNRIHSAGAVADYFMNVVKRGDLIAWDSTASGHYETVHSLDQAISSMHAVQNEGTYFDIHRWCFVPHLFRLLIADLNQLGLIALKEASFHETVGCEFYLTLSREGDGPSLSRLQMMKLAEEEIAT